MNLSAKGFQNAGFIVLSPAIFLTLLFAPLHASAEDAAAKTCASTLNLRFERLDQDFIKVNGVAITGDFFYPVEMVLSNLGLDEPTLRGLMGAELISLGEGVSGLVPFLRRREINAKGLDLWYGADGFPANYTGQLMRQYVRDHGDHLIQGDARRIPKGDESVDLVVSHMLVNNVDLETTKAVLQDALRITRKGGEVRIFGFEPTDVGPLTGILNGFYGQGISEKFETKEWKVRFRGRTLEHKYLLLTVRKLRDGVGASEAPLRPLR